MSESAVRAAVERRDVERWLNQITLSPEDLIVVPGGVVHAIRAGTFTAEWSMAPGRDPSTNTGGQGTDLSQATATLFDGTDGRAPRPGKEDTDAALDIMRGTGGLQRFVAKSGVPIKFHDDGQGNTRVFLFRTSQVFVEQWEVSNRLMVPGGQRGYGLFVESGSVRLEAPDQGAIGSLELHSGDEAFVPAGTQTLDVVVTNGPLGVASTARVQTWYAPLPHERDALAG